MPEAGARQSSAATLRGSAVRMRLELLSLGGRVQQLD
jgi:hypothetical protein